MNRTTKPVQSAPARVRRGWLKWGLAISALLLTALLALAAFAFKTEAGARLLWRTTSALVPGLSGELLKGTLADGLAIRNFRFDRTGIKLAADRINGSWSLAWRPLALTVASIEIGALDVTPVPEPDKKEAKVPPQQIRLPLALDLRRASIGVLRLHLDGGTQSVAGIDISARSDRVHHQFALLHALTAWGPARADLSVDGSGPVRLNGDMSLDGRVLGQPITGKLRVTGPLEQLDLRLRSEGRQLFGQVDLIATPYAELPLQSATVVINHLNPREFVPAAPRADLQVRATLVPDQPASQPSGQQPAGPPPAGQQPAGELRLTGPVTIRNGRPGPIDQDMLPLQSIAAQLALTAQRQQVTGLQVELPGNGRLTGSASMEGDNGQLQLQAQRIDLKRLLTSLQPTDLNGPISVTLAGAEQQLEAQLSGKPLSIAAKADLTPQEIVVHQARLQSGTSIVQASGKLARDETAAYSLQGKLENFDPNRFIKLVPATAGSRAIKTIPVGIRVNMDFSSSGQLQPELQAGLVFAIRNSRFNDLPLTGKGNLRVHGKKMLPGQAQVTVAGNELSLDGSFGEPDSRLRFRIAAPSLDRLGLGARGKLQASGTLAGSIDRPALQLQWEADQLAFGEQRLTQSSGNASINGVPGRDAAATVDVAIKGRGIHAGPLSLGQLQASLTGSSADHRLELDASGKLRGQPLDLQLAAQGAVAGLPGGVTGQPAGNAALGWKGTVSKLDNRGFPRLSLRRPLALSASANSVELGATQLLLEQATLDLTELIWRQDMVRSAGRLQDLNIGHVLALQRELTGNELPVNSDLVLDGQWDLTLANTASGSFGLRRRGGDLTLKSARGDIALDINRLALSGQVEGSALRINAGIGTQRLGSLDADGTVGLLQQGSLMMPGPDSALTMRVLANVPRLSTVAALAGPQVALEGRVNADIRAGGTLGSPTLSGNVLGEALALTLFDQGVRLHDGVARLELADNTVELREVRFRGGDGTLRATGRIPLDRNSTGIGANIVAERLQLLADPSRQLTLSGKATANNRNGQLQVTGGFTVDRALFSLPEASAPSLDDDVVVIDRQTAPPPAKRKTGSQPEQPGLFPPLVELDLNLGNNFRFRGSGADLRLAGSLSIRSGPGQPPQAFGTVRVVDGAYEAFGAKLLIEQGLITFQGPFSNPTLNIIAMRREQEVPAGVQVTGNAQKPRIQLVSEPDLSEEEKLSWLVFGRGTSSGGGGAGQAQAALQGAALGLLNKLGSNRIAGELGLNKLAIGASDYGTLAGQPVVTLGKNISNRLFIGYEQSLAGIGGVLKLTYELSRHWSVVLLGGTVSGLDLLYSDRFDRWGERDRRRRK